MKKQMKTLLLATTLTLLFSVQAFAGWTQTETGQWGYDQDGVVLTSQWIKDQDSWYYLDADGTMLANTIEQIDGTDYVFNTSGKWIESAAIQTNGNDRVYTNTDAGYSFQIPEEFEVKIPEGGDLEIKSAYISILFAHTEIPKNEDKTKLIDNFIAGFLNEASGVTLISNTSAQVGDYVFQKAQCTYSDFVTIDLYTLVQDQQLLSVTSLYLPQDEVIVQETLSGLKQTP